MGKIMQTATGRQPPTMNNITPGMGGMGGGMGGGVGPSMMGNSGFNPVRNQ